MRAILTLIILVIFSKLAYGNNVKSVVPRNDIPPDAGEASDDSFDLKLQPQLTVDDNTLKPAITLFTRSNSLFTRTYKGQDTPFFDNYFLFQFTANSGIKVSDFENPTDSTDQIISEYVADGGNIEFDLSYRVAYNDWDFSLGGFYSLLSTDAISTEQGASDIIDVDAEVYGLSLFASYSFNKVILFSEFRTFDTSDDGQNADFTKILDDGDATEFGVSFPLSILSQNDGAENDRDGFYLTLSRTKHSEVDKAIFRVTVQKRFDF
ncbi:hypothetical protein MTsDn5_19980 [Alteromonas gracilis]|uniref:hypothetical protein n=1 Tax=Alteromonas gracilis TaxID=1479524 RepID=UPI0036F1EB1A